ncbi:MAG: immunoglobulin-like domain-containing protein [Patescibacteria group bacterium]
MFSTNNRDSWAVKAASIISALVLVGVFPAAAFANMSFTSSTLDGGNSTTVAPSASVSVSLTVNLTSGDDWRSTGWRIADELNSNGSGGGAYTCIDTPDHNTSSGSHSFTETFSITAPVIEDTYDVQFKAYDQNGCSGSPSVFVHKNNGITVEIPDVCPNIAGDQETVPEGMEIVAGLCIPIVVPNTPPIVTLNGDAEMNITVGGTYTELGAFWIDAQDGSGSAVVGGDSVDTATVGTYVVEYSYTDVGNLTDTETRVVNVVPLTDEEQCALDGGTWLGEECDFPPTPEETCVTEGGAWIEGACVFPPTPAEQCVLDGGVWIEGECDIPTPQETCETDGGFWNGTDCEDIANCDEETQTYDEETNTCTDSQEEPVDTDGDTIPDATDNCDSAANVEQTDTDEDGIGDACDSNEGEEENNEGSNEENENPVAETPANETSGSDYFATCMNNRDDDNDGLTDMNDPGCGNPFDSFENDEVPNAPVVGGSVESDAGGDTESEVLGTSCSILTNYIGQDTDNVEDVVFLQNFLNKELGTTLDVNGIFDEITKKAVEAFQLKYWEEILKPWVPFGLSVDEPTGIVYKTTQRMINMLSCPGMEIPMPELP